MRKFVILSVLVLALLITPLIVCNDSEASYIVPTEEGLKINYEIIEDATATDNGKVKTVPGNVYKGTAKALVIPSTVTIGLKVYDVTMIGASSFKAWNINSISIPGTVTEIGESAFQSCYQVKEVRFGGTIAEDRIGKNAFDLGLESVPAECSIYGFTPTRDVGQDGNPYEDIFGKYTKVHYEGYAIDSQDSLIHIALIAVGVFLLIFMGRSVKVKKIKRKKRRSNS